MSDLPLQNFGVVVVVYGAGARKVLENYPAIYEELGRNNIPVVIVDHGAHEYDPQDFIRPNIRYLKQENKGFGAGVNLGCRELFKKCEYAFVLNPDLEFSISELLDFGAELNLPFYVLQVKEFGNVCAIFYYNRITGLIANSPSLGAISYFNGAAFCISKACFQRTKGFDENFFLYFEDVDFSMQLHRLNIPLEILPTNTFVHEVGGSRTKGMEIFIQRAAAQSALRLVRKWYWFNPWLFIRYSLKWLLAGVRNPAPGPSKAKISQ
ncbi:glycosyltransferase family 2 protein [Polynucleobacter yangtzensis]|uniref:Glycosyltransferase 2-like domain-containing protein n=1 Tax=Polynucleobacter yangtzensis TaxID=1743159 RepID=A0ABN6TSP1_9BURK|nr:glycosyltransferase family 2 protein [Polynucleobacter yangtzensis]BDT78432.1 hypothetical protein PKF032_03200 [Polynucleobacter yangtzensis]